MLGRAIDDPHGVEMGGTEQALGLLPIRTRMNPEKITREAAGELVAPRLFGQSFECAGVEGYEIHVGETDYLEQAFPLFRITRKRDSSSGLLDGCVSSDGRVAGTYLHGIFHQDAFRHAFLGAARSSRGLTPAAMLGWKQLREGELDRLARTVSNAVDLTRLLGLVGLSWPAGDRKERTCASTR